MIEVRIVHDREPLRQLAASLREAADQLLRALSAPPAVEAIGTAANDNEEAAPSPRRLPDDPMTLEEVKFELRLNDRQVVALRRLWGFPVPCHHAGRLVFSRHEVQRWVKRQPDPTRPAAVLRLRRRRLGRDDR